MIMTVLVPLENSMSWLKQNFHFAFVIHRADLVLEDMWCSERPMLSDGNVTEHPDDFYLPAMMELFLHYVTKLFKHNLLMVGGSS
jgi:hypothetical protein